MIVRRGMAGIKRILVGWMGRSARTRRETRGGAIEEARRDRNVDACLPTAGDDSRPAGARQAGGAKANWMTPKIMDELGVECRAVLATGHPAASCSRRRQGL
jgi:hypothetical protein